MGKSKLKLTAPNAPHTDKHNRDRQTHRATDRAVKKCLLELKMFALPSHASGGSTVDKDEGFQRARETFRHSALLPAVIPHLVSRESVKGDTVPRRNLRCGKTNTESDTSLYRSPLQLPRAKAPLLPPSLPSPLSRALK